MCTVTFLPSGNRVFIASNRDEKHVRADALEPLVYKFSTGDVLFPKDRDAGGTWIALHQNGNAVIFLNGGFTSHEPKSYYGRSRGLILLDMIEDPQPKEKFEKLDFEFIEPFTAVILQAGDLFECVWSGDRKYVVQKDSRLPHIWSSSTLYDQEVRAKRTKWFQQWLADFDKPELEDVISFHKFSGDGDKYNDLLMNREGKMLTVSITGIELHRDSGRMTYLDLKNDREFHVKLPFSNS